MNRFVFKKRMQISIAAYCHENIRKIQLAPNKNTKTKWARIREHNTKHNTILSLVQLSIHCGHRSLLFHWTRFFGSLCPRRQEPSCRVAAASYNASCKMQLATELPQNCHRSGIVSSSGASSDDSGGHGDGLMSAKILPMNDTIFLFEKKSNNQ